MIRVQLCFFHLFSLIMLPCWAALHDDTMLPLLCQVRLVPRYIFSLPSLQGVCHPPTRCKLNATFTSICINICIILHRFVAGTYRTYLHTLIPPPEKHCSVLKLMQSLGKLGKVLRSREAIGSKRKQTDKLKALSVCFCSAPGAWCCEFPHGSCTASSTCGAGRGGLGAGLCSLMKLVDTF